MGGVSGAKTLRHQNFSWLANQILAPIAEEPLRLRIDDRNAPVLVDDQHGVRRRLQQHSELLFRLCGRILKSDFFGDQQVAMVLTGRIEARCENSADMETLTVLMHSHKNAFPFAASRCLLLDGPPAYGESPT